MQTPKYIYIYYIYYTIYTIIYYNIYTYMCGCMYTPPVPDFGCPKYSFSINIPLKCPFFTQDTEEGQGQVFHFRTNFRLGAGQWQVWGFNGLKFKKSKKIDLILMFWVDGPRIPDINPPHMMSTRFCQYWLFFPPIFL